MGIDKVFPRGKSRWLGCHVAGIRGTRVTQHNFHGERFPFPSLPAYFSISPFWANPRNKMVVLVHPTLMLVCPVRAYNSAAKFRPRARCGVTPPLTSPSSSSSSPDGRARSKLRVRYCIKFRAGTWRTFRIVTNTCRIKFSPGEGKGWETSPDVAVFDSPPICHGPRKPSIFDCHLFSWTSSFSGDNEISEGMGWDLRIGRLYLYVWFIFFGTKVVIVKVERRG